MHLWAEFGTDPEGAKASLGRLSSDDPAREVVEGMIAFAQGDLEAARSHVAAVDLPDDQSFAKLELAWLRGMLAAAVAVSMVPSAASCVSMA